MAQVSVILKRIKKPNQQKVLEYMFCNIFILFFLSLYLRKTLIMKHMLSIEKKGSKK